MIVAETSVLIEALGVAAGSEALRARLAGDELHVPSLVDYEIVAALRRLTIRGDLTAARAEDLLGDFADLPLRRWPSSDGLRRRALMLCDAMSPYDAAFVALAEALGCELLTRDARLARSHSHHATIVAC